MSARNKQPRKHERAAERAQHQVNAFRAMPFGGVIVRGPDVRNHRYLAAHGLPHSAKLAAVLLPSDTYANGVKPVVPHAGQLV